MNYQEGMGEEVHVLHPETNEKVLGTVIVYDEESATVRINEDTIKIVKGLELIKCFQEKNTLKILR